MAATVLYMSMSLDGFVAGPNESVDNGLGDRGERLHEWIFAGAPTEHGGVPGRPAGVDGEVMDEAMATGAVVAGDKDVLVHGATVAQLALAAGVLDEIQIHLVPVLLGEGRRLFEHLGADHIELEPIRVQEGAGVTHLRYRVCR